MKRLSYFVLLFLSLNNLLFMKSLESNDFIKVKIISCYDGDTCTSSKGEKIRLACIDTPEIRGNKVNLEKALFARDYLNSKVEGKFIKLKRITTDRYNRTVGELYVENINIQELLYKKGLAKIYKKYAYQCPWTKKYI
jgi:endonuclease YncB( thermonuclease family)|tara:strand:- start:252 stop:665 length:414 start_codon:yes stop_codon:yes gene_type:complete